MHKPPLQPLVYSRLFPRPGHSDPVDFTHFITQCLVPEVRSETLRFYGTYDVLEAQYPGLDYSSSAHRLRLRCFPWHRRLFRVFDELRLSEGEIYMLCRWEGTRWAKDKYEKDHCMKIKDTTWDDIRPYRRRVLPVASIPSRSYIAQRGGQGCEGLAVLSDQRGGISRYPAFEPDEDVLSNSIGMSLNQRLRAATAARLRGQDVGLDAAWEQWMKDTTEGRRHSSRPNSMPIMASSQLYSLRSRSRWSQNIPEVFRFASSSSQPPAISYVEEAQRRSAAPPIPPSSRHRSNTSSIPRSSPSSLRRWR